MEDESEIVCQCRDALVQEGEGMVSREALGGWLVSVGCFRKSIAVEEERRVRRLGRRRFDGRHRPS